MLEHLPATLALIGIVVLVSSLLSGWVDRTGLPQVAIFLLLCVALGPLGLGLLDFTLRSPSLQVIATLALVLVLFSDAIGVDIREARRNRRLALFVLGPGTLLPALLIAVAAAILLRLSALAALILGAALASTDPVLLRSLVRRPELPGDARIALRLEEAARANQRSPLETWGPWITMGAGGAFVATGLYFGVRSSSTHDDAVASPVQRDALELQHSAERSATIANVMFVLGGVAIAGGIGWKVYQWRTGTETTAVVRATPTGAAIVGVW